MKFGVVVFPGSNCDRDIFNTIQSDLGKEVEFLWHKDKDIKHFSTGDCIVLPGGFSYGDYLRCGAIARFSPMMQSVISFAHKGGRVLGICNGFQILCESGLLPGALLMNAHRQFICKNVHLKGNDHKIYKIPVAHGDGRYYANENILDDMERNGQVILHYCNESGEMTSESNPNGASRNIAGIKNKPGNVIGLMPHPERASNPLCGNSDGIRLFEYFEMN
ncbi:MAG: phosphoribosylformylglycinamidine synthase subunit PurQ [Bacteroidetes bacterium]|nr:phosphoribosylformylglycinamidine synthase subunit PurQ [Bacteroidota bacterium]